MCGKVQNLRGVDRHRATRARSGVNDTITHDWANRQKTWKRLRLAHPLVLRPQIGGAPPHGSFSRENRVLLPQVKLDSRETSEGKFEFFFPVRPGAFSGSIRTETIADHADHALNLRWLTAMITPAIFMTANASLIISTSNRVSRVVDRIRVLNDLADKLDRGMTDLDFRAERLGHYHDQMRWSSAEATAFVSRRPPSISRSRRFWEQA